MPEFGPGEKRFAALCAAVIFGLVCTQLTHNLLVGVVLGYLTFKLLENTLIMEPSNPLLEPPAKSYPLPHFIVVGVLKDNMPTVHFEDRWWTLKNPIHQQTDTLTFAVNWDSKEPNRKGIQAKNQVTLVCIVKDIADGAMLKNHYQIHAQGADFDIGTEIVRVTQEQIGRMLLKAMSDKAAVEH